MPFTVLCTPVLVLSKGLYSPFLFALYTAKCIHRNDNSLVVKFADDTRLAGLIPTMMTSTDRRLIILLQDVKTII